MSDSKHSERWGLVTLLLWTFALGAIGLGVYVLVHLIIGKR